MKHLTLFFAVTLLLASCTSQKKLAYLGNLPPAGGEETFPVDIPDYKIKPHDVLYITVKAMTPDGTIKDFLSGGAQTLMNSGMGEMSSLYGYSVNPEGNIVLPVVGTLKVSGLTLEETRKTIQVPFEKVFKNSTVECKLLSFKFTVIGEVRSPGTFTNSTNYLTVLEAIGRAGGLTDQGNRSRVLVVRTFDKETKTFRINLQDNKIFSSEVYSLLPNDVIIVEPLKQKILSLNLPTFSAIVGVITATLLLINYFGK